MKFIIPVLAVLPALVVADCPTANWIAGLQGIEASVAKLSMDVAAYPITTAPCPFVNLTVILNDVGALTKKISDEANAIKGCAGVAAGCGNVHAEVTNHLISSVSALSSVITAHKGVICCTHINKIVSSEAGLIKQAVDYYSAQIAPKVPAGACQASVAADVNAIDGYITGVIKTVDPC